MDLLALDMDTILKQKHKTGCFAVSAKGHIDAPERKATFAVWVESCPSSADNIICATMKSVL